jgi:hypothetical protein
MDKKAFFIIMVIFGFIILMYLITINTSFQSELQEISYDRQIKNLEVKKAYNERGIYILNDMYYLSTSTFIIETSDKISIEDDAIWRPKGNKYYPRISDIEAPFVISKKKDSDTIFIEKSGNKILLFLSK